jgi:hypothetical protein
MPTFLSDPSPTLLMLLLVATVVAVGLWLRNRKRTNAIVAAVFGLLLLLLVLCDQFVESPREEAIRRVIDMTDAATAVEPDRFVSHVSQSFDYKGAKRDQLRTSGAWSFIRQHRATVTAAAFSRDDFEQPTPDTVVIGFLAKGQLPDGQRGMWYTKTTFVRDPDGAYRLKGMKFFNPINTRSEETIPGFP